MDQSGSADGTDLQLIQDYLLGKITEFSKSSAGSDETNPTAYMEQVKNMMTEYAPAGITEEKTEP